MTTPCGRDGKVNPVVLAGSKEAGADRVFKIGGAQAIAALAYGTESIPKVDKIVDLETSTLPLQRKPYTEMSASTPSQAQVRFLSLLMRLQIRGSWQPIS